MQCHFASPHVCLPGVHSSTNLAFRMSSPLPCVESVSAATSPSHCVVICRLAAQQISKHGPIFAYSRKASDGTSLSVALRMIAVMECVVAAPLQLPFLTIFVESQRGHDLSLVFARCRSVLSHSCGLREGPNWISHPSSLAQAESDDVSLPGVCCRVPVCCLGSGANQS